MAKNKIVYQGRTYDVLGAGELHLATSLLPEQVEPDTLNVTVWSTDKALMDFVLDAPVTLYYDDSPVGIYYLQSVTRTGRRSYELYAESAVGLLIKRPHRGGIYTGQTAAEVLAPIFGVVPWRCKSSLAKIALYGWLPYCKPTSSSARDNLLRVLLALGAVLRTDRNGKLCVVPLWDGLSSQAGRDRLGLDASVSMDAKVTAVAVTEHQYLAGTEEADLFEGTTTDGYEVIFDEPMHSLTAEGFAITDSGPNYAILSAGSGTLRGKKYIHNTSIVRRSTGHSGPENIVTLPDDNTLVSLTNAQAVASRLAAYYKQPERIDGPLAYIGEAAGDRLRVWHPYDNVYTTACAETVDVTLSNLLAAQETMVVGYVPPKPEAERIDTEVVIRQSGTHTVPANATYVVGYLIGAGDGGSSGVDGKPVSPGSLQQASKKETSEATMYTKAYPPVLGGDGGEAGEAGAAGKVLRFEMTVTPGTTFAVTIGAGGAGGEPNGTDHVPGAEGGATTFGSLTSASGFRVPGGVRDDFSGTIYAVPGSNGVDGGKGSGVKGWNIQPTGSAWEWGEVVEGTSVTYNGQTWTPGSSAPSEVASGERDIDEYGVHYLYCQRGFGGGPAVGSNGYRGSTGALDGSRPGQGADAAAPADQTTPGCGGHGGHGGGGVGSAGYNVTRLRVWGDKIGTMQSVRTPPYSYTSSRPGKGSRGSNGAPGIILLYYSTSKPDTSGWAADKNKRWRLDKFGRRCIV